MKRLDSLTPSQQRAIAHFTQTTIAQATSTHTNRFQTEEAILRLYKSHKISKPSVHWLSNPLWGAVTAKVLQPSIRDSLVDKPIAQARTLIQELTSEGVRDEIGDYLGGLYEVVGAIGLPVREQVTLQGSDDEDEDEDEEFFGESLASVVEGIWECGLLEVGLYRQVLSGLKEIDPLLEVGASVGWVWFFEDTVICVPKPRKLSLKGGVLHGVCAVGWEGWSINAWNGVIEGGRGVGQGRSDWVLDLN